MGGIIIKDIGCKYNPLFLQQLLEYKMVLFLSIAGIFLSILLISFSARNYRSSIYLGLFFFLLSLYAFYLYALIYSQSVFWVKFFLFLIPIFGTLLYLIGPMLFWYIRSVITDHHKLRKSDWWHFLPAAIFFFAALPGLFSSQAGYADAARVIASNADAIGTYKPTLLSVFMPFPVLFLSRPIIILGYTIAAIVILLRYFLNHDKSSTFHGQSFMRKWLITLLGSLFVLVLSHIFILLDFTSDTINLFAFLKTLQIISATAITGLLVSPFFFPAILYGLPRLPDTVVIPGNDAIAEETRMSKASIVSPGDLKQSNIEKESLISASKSNNSNFEFGYLEFIGKQTDHSMKEFQPYLQQDFNLAQLSALAHIPVHHLSYYFREVKQMSFTDYRNQWRVDHAKNLIHEGKFNELTLEAIGFLSGFASRNTFLNAFKKAEGTSPNAFLTQLKKK